MVRIEILRDGAVVHEHPVGAQPVHVGRAPTNDLVLVDGRVSGRHLVAWVDGDEIWVEDVGSRNGTTVGGQDLRGRGRVPAGGEVVLGGGVTLRFAGEPEARLYGALVLEHVDSGVRVPVRSDRVALAADAVLLVHADELWLGTGDDTVEVRIDEAFTVGDRRFVVREVAGDPTQTEGLEQARYAYALEVTLDGPTGAAATLRDLQRGVIHEVTSEIRAVLLYVLAKRRADDLAEGHPSDEAGWMADDDVASGVWGRERLRQEANNYHVLVHRLRKELSGHGFDPWFIEKKRKHLRLRLDQVRLGGMVREKE